MINFSSNQTTGTKEKIDQPLFEGQVKFDVTEYSCKIVVTYDFTNPANLLSYLQKFESNKSDKGNLPLIKTETVNFLGIRLELGGYARNISAVIESFKGLVNGYQLAKGRNIDKIRKEYGDLALRYSDSVADGKKEESERLLKKLKECRKVLQEMGG